MAAVIEGVVDESGELGCEGCLPEFAVVGVWEGEGEGEVAEGVLLPMGFLVEVEVGERGWEGEGRVGCWVGEFGLWIFARSIRRLGSWGLLVAGMLLVGRSRRNKNLPLLLDRWSR